MTQNAYYQWINYTFVIHSGGWLQMKKQVDLEKVAKLLDVDFSTMENILTSTTIPITDSSVAKIGHTQ